VNEKASQVFNRASEALDVFLKIQTGNFKNELCKELDMKGIKKIDSMLPYEK